MNVIRDPAAPRFVVDLIGFHLTPNGDSQIVSRSPISLITSNIVTALVPSHLITRSARRSDFLSSPDPFSVFVAERIRTSGAGLDLPKAPQGMKRVRDCAPLARNPTRAQLLSAELSVRKPGALAFA